MAKLPSRFLFSLALGASVLIALSACSAPRPVQPTAAESPQSGTLDRRVGDVGGTGGDGFEAIVTLVTADGSTLTLKCTYGILSLPLQMGFCGAFEGTGRLTEARVWDSYIDKSGEPVFPVHFLLNQSAVEVGLLISLRGGEQAYLSEGTLAATINLLNAGSCEPEEEIILDVDITGHLPHIGKVNGTITAVCPPPQGP